MKSTMAAFNVVKAASNALTAAGITKITEENAAETINILTKGTKFTAIQKEAMA